MLYCGGSDADKTSTLFSLLEDNTTGLLNYGSSKYLRVLEIMTYIPSIIIGDTVSLQKKFSSDQEEEQFEELMQLYTTNSAIIKEFSYYLSNSFLFTSDEDRMALRKIDFQIKIENSNYVLVKPNEIRKLFTEFVINNKSRALLPSKLPSR